MLSNEHQKSPNELYIVDCMRNVDGQYKNHIKNYEFTIWTKVRTE